jgi:CRISPR/Cas system-associated exonuclease Cas4 (RecB family)
MSVLAVEIARRLELRRSRTLSKSDFKVARTCDAKLWFRENGFVDDRNGDAYMQMLAMGGYMVEALACAKRPDGILLEYGRDAAEDYRQTLELLERDEVTIFQATLLYGRRLARVDIIEKRGNIVKLLEVKAKSFDGADHAANLADGGHGLFRGKKRPHPILGDWMEKLEDVAFQAIMLEQALPAVTVIPYLVLVDKTKRTSLDDLPRLFEIEREEGKDGVSRIHTARYVGTREQLDQLDLLTEVNVSAEVAMLRDGVDAESSRFERMLDMPFDAAWAQRGSKCGSCEYREGNVGKNGFSICWGALADVEPHALDLLSIGTVKDADGTPVIEALARRGTVSLFDIPEDRLVKKDGTIGPQAVRQLRQLRHMKSGEVWVGTSLAPKIQSLTYPLHFIDFEATRLALPYHAGMRPYGQVAFQWSCHTVDAPGATPRHSEWLNDIPEWPNLAFPRSLRERIGDAGTVLTWSSYEASQLREIAGEHDRFAAFDASLVAWVGAFAPPRVVDLLKWAADDFYHPGMGGRTSIKVVLDSLWKSDQPMRDQFTAWTGAQVSESEDPYHALPALMIAGVPQDVREGTGAMRAYEAMMFGVEQGDAETKARWRQLLLQYCKLDTLSMVLIFEHWRRITGMTS